MTAAVDIAARELGELARRDVPLGPATTYRVGGSAALAVTAQTSEDMRRVASAVQASGVRVLVVGKGSNLLVADAGFDGLAVFLGDAFSQIDVAETRVRAGAAAALPVVARQVAVHGLRGFEWAVGVPGSIGGAVRMNAGGHSSEMAAVLEGVRVVDLATGEDREVPATALDLRYRASAVTATQVVLDATLVLREGDRAEAEAAMREVVRWRRAHQPGGQNAGSVFTNPEGDFAARLVEESGMKGVRLGSAEVSPKHANFIQADAGGSADDIYALMQQVRERVAATFGVVLRTETHLVGFDDAEVAP